MQPGHSQCAWQTLLGARHLQCTPSDPGDGCSASAAAKGFTLAGGTWTFTASPLSARNMNADDIACVSCGWRLRKTESDATYTGSALVDEKVADPGASGLNGLNGTATYQGGAAGKCVLASSTGGTDGADHLTAGATLDARFTNDAEHASITCTPCNFMGVDGQSRDWDVALNGSIFADIGAIGDPTNGGAWSICGTKAAAFGEWSRVFRKSGVDGVPRVASGTFYSACGTADRTVGVFREVPHCRASFSCTSADPVAGRFLLEWRPGLIRGMCAGGTSLRRNVGSIEQLFRKTHEMLTIFLISYTSNSRCLCYRGSRISRAVSPSVTYPCRPQWPAGVLVCCGTRLPGQGAV